MCEMGVGEGIENCSFYSSFQLFFLKQMMKEEPKGGTQTCSFISATERNVLQQLRNAVIFQPSGLSYVYLSHTMVSGETSTIISGFPSFFLLSLSSLSWWDLLHPGSWRLLRQLMQNSLTYSQMTSSWLLLPRLRKVAPAGRGMAAACFYVRNACFLSWRVKLNGWSMNIWTYVQYEHVLYMLYMGLGVHGPHT